jgi:hypothetical protein
MASEAIDSIGRSLNCKYCLVTRIFFFGHFVELSTLETMHLTSMEEAQVGVMNYSFHNKREAYN